MMTPMPTQVTGAEFLAARRTALLADEPRVGKTGAAILAADQIGAKTILVVTTASGRGVWRRGFALWSSRPRLVSVIGVDKHDAHIWIVSYDALLRGETFALLMKQQWNLLILDEDHKIKSPEAKRSQAVYGRWNGRGEPLAQGLASRAERVWHLTGTPLPHDPGDMWCRLRSSNPEVLNGQGDWPDVLTYDRFRERYCVIRMKKISNFNSIPVVIGGRNLPELRARIGDWMLRRTQADVGIRPPTYDLLPLIVSAADRKRTDGDVRRIEILDAAARGDTKQLDIDLGPLRRLTGVIKAHAIIDAVRDELDGNNDKLVLMYFHREVGDILEEELAEFYPVRIDGQSSPSNRDTSVLLFSTLSGRRIFLGQIDAAGEAIDLSAASVLWFVETVFSPKSMAQAALRITNVNQKRNCFVKVCCLAGSIDESIQASLMRLWASIREVIT